VHCGDYEPYNDKDQNEHIGLLSSVPDKIPFGSSVTPQTILSQGRQCKYMFWRRSLKELAPIEGGLPLGEGI
jgi:hypothetical protein